MECPARGQVAFWIKTGERGAMTDQSIVSHSYIRRPWRIWEGTPGLLGNCNIFSKQKALSM